MQFQCKKNDQRRFQEFMKFGTKTTSPSSKYHLLKQFRCWRTMLCLSHHLKWMVRSTLLWGGGLGRPKAGNRPIGNMSWERANSDHIIDILTLIYGFRRHEPGTRKSSEVRRFRFKYWLPSELEFWKKYRCISASPVWQNDEKWFSQDWVRMIQVMSRSH